MHKKVSLVSTVIWILVAVVVTFQATFIALNNEYSHRMEQYQAESAFSDKLTLLDSLYRSRYIGEIDEKTLSDTVMLGYVLGTGDKYASYFTAEAFEEYVSDDLGQTVGVGVHVAYVPEDEVLQIIAVMPDSPALEAGLLVGDRIYAVDGVTVAEVGYNETVNRVRGTEGTTVCLSVLREGKTLDFTVSRRTVTSLSVTGRMLDPQIPTSAPVGVIRISEFDATTAGQFHDTLTALREQGAAAFVFDVRNNPGGDLTAILSVLDELLPEGPIVRITDKAGSEKVYNSGAECLPLPMAVVCNGQTYSAAELFTSALKDYAHKGLVSATVVGTTTYGKGTVLNIYPLGDGSAVALSTQLYCPPFTENFEGVGVEPDLTVEMSEEAAAVNLYLLEDGKDDQLMAAVRALALSDA